MKRTFIYGLLALLLWSGCTVKKTDVLGYWKTSDDEEQLIVFDRYGDLVVEYKKRAYNGYALTIYTTPAHLEDGSLKLEDAKGYGKAYPPTIIYKNGSLIYNEKEFNQSDADKEMVKKRYEEARKRQEEEKTESPFIKNPNPSNMGNVSALRTIQSHSELEAKYGKKNVESVFSAMFGKTEIIRGTILFGGTPNQVIFAWRNEDYTGLEYIYVYAQRQGDKIIIPDWQFNEVAIGLSLKELQDRNNKAFTFLGLGNFDQSGEVLSYNEGILSRSGEYAQIESTGNAPYDILQTFMGYKEVSSDKKYSDKLNLYVRGVYLK